MNRRKLLSALLISLFCLTSLTSCVPEQKPKQKKMPKAETEDLMNELVPFAQQLLAEHGEFFPFGGFINSKGEIVNIGSYDETEKPPSQKLIAMMVESFREKAKAEQYRATAILFDVKVQIPESKGKTDAIQINLDHIDEYSVEVFLPYIIKKDGEVEYGETFVQKGNSKIFN